MTKDLTEQYEVGGTIICAEGSYVYTENGIEKVHYCQVGCITERVTPKANIIAPVPSYEEYSRLEWYAGCGPDRIVELNHENRKLKELLNYIRDEIADMPACSYQWGFRWVHEAAYKIDEVLK